MLLTGVFFPSLLHLGHVGHGVLRIRSRQSRKLLISTSVGAPLNNLLLSAHRRLSLLELFDYNPESMTAEIGDGPAIFDDVKLRSHGFLTGGFLSCLLVLKPLAAPFVGKPTPFGFLSSVLS